MHNASSSASDLILLCLCMAPKKIPFSKLDEIFVVGIASSAGGIPPLMALLEEAHCHKNMCFVLTPHLSRDYESSLPGLLERVSGLKAVTITHNMILEHCKLFVLPNDSYAVLEGNCFKLLPRPAHGPNNASDIMFASLAECHRKNSIGVVLSGASVGADGSRGIRAIFEAGGHTYAQDPSTAIFPQMPELAIETGCVHSILSAEEIGNELTLASWGSNS
jgi:two-component system CheB/CheR fusion protein